MSDLEKFETSKQNAEDWLQENCSKFQLISGDPNEARLVFKHAEAQISFSITCPNRGEQWIVWSDQDKVLNAMQDVHSYLDGRENVTIDCILHRVTSSLTRFTSPKLEQSDSESEVDDKGDDNASDMDDDDADFFNDYYSQGEEFTNDQDDDCSDDDKKSKEDEDQEMDLFFKSNGDKAMPATIQRLVTDMRGLMKTGETYGFTACPEGNNLFKWKVKLLNISDDCKLGKDLKIYAQKMKEEPVIHMEMQFPMDFPFSPPFMRVIRPRFKFLTGHVTIGGSICMQMLTKSGWLPTNDIESILVQVRSEILSDPNASLDQAHWNRPYTEAEAKAAFNRMVARYGWNK